MNCLPMHENIVRGFGIKRGPDSTLIAMEMCQGTLDDEIQQQDGIGPEALRALMRCLNQGFNCLWKHNIVHGDMKPQNILVVNGIYKIADFGLSCFARPEQKLEKASGSFSYCHPLVFKAIYWSKIGLPKMPKGKLPRDIDIYSMGVLLFQACCNKLPFNATSHKAMYELISAKPNNAIRGTEVLGRLFYGIMLPRSSLRGTQKEIMTQLLIHLLEVCAFFGRHFLLKNGGIKNSVE